MIVYVVFGGMLATTWVQIIKAILLMAGTILLSILVLAHFHFSFGAFFDAIDARHLSRQRRRDRDRTSCSRACLQAAVGRARSDLAGARADLRHGGPAAHPGPLLHRARRQDGPHQRGLGHGADRQLLHHDHLPRLRRGDHRGPRFHRTHGGTNMSAPLLAQRWPAIFSSPSSRRSRSPRSWPWSPG